MSKIEIGNIRLKDNKDNESKKRVADAEERKKSNDETLEEAWARIKQSKGYEKDKTKLDEVYEAQKAGEIPAREPLEEGKKRRQFSAAEALRLWRILEDQKKEERIQSLVESTPSNYVLVNNEPSLDGLRRAIQSANIIAIDCETYGEKPGEQLDPWAGGMAGFSVTANDYHYYIPLNHTVGDQLSEEAVWQALKEPMESTYNVMHNAPFDGKFFFVQYGVDIVKNLLYDTQLLGWAADETMSHRLKDMSEEFLGLTESWTFDKLFASMHEFHKVPLDAALVYGAGDTEKTKKLLDFMTDKFKASSLKLFEFVQQYELPVLKQFIYADLRGLSFDVEESHRLDKEFEKEVVQLEKEIFELAGEEFNIGSSDQLAKVLFDKLKIKKISKRSTKKEVLEKLQNEHAIIPKIQEYRQVSKLREAFTQKLPKVVKPDGKIHQSHNTWGAKTTRFTCKNPNTQQMPSKRPEIRKMFYPDEGRIFFGIDYSQIELRVLAHLANEQALIEAFREGKDIHSLTASKISNYSYEDIEKNKDVEGSGEQKARKNAKPVNFGIVYGLTSYGLSNQLGISEGEAQGIIDAFFKSYQGIKNYMNEQKRKARKNGYVTDMFGRKRRLKAMYDNKWYGSADRMAGNMPIQASAGGILKIASVHLIPLLEQYDVDIALQIHDELLFSAPEDLPREAMEAIKQTMEDAVELSVPVLCDVEISPNYWMENLSMDEWYGN